jgi:hypothetical protein
MPQDASGSAEGASKQDEEEKAKASLGLGSLRGGRMSRVLVVSGPVGWEVREGRCWKDNKDCQWLSIEERMTHRD